MREQPRPRRLPRRVRAVYRGILRLAGRRHRERFTRQQLILFEDLWANERPAGVIRSELWLAQQLVQCLRSSLAIRRDARPSSRASAHSGDWLQGVLFDAKISVRTLARAPWFSLGALLTFALGIGVNVAVFAAVDRMLFRALPYPAADRLVVMEEFSRRTGGSSGTLPAPYVVAAAHQHTGLTDAAITGFDGAFHETPEPADDRGVRLVEATAGVLRLLRVPVIRGRDFTDDDARAKRAVALIGYNTWQSRFGGRDDIVGLRLWSGARATEIIGVLPRGFLVPASVLSLEADGFVLDDNMIDHATATERSARPYFRLAPAVSLAAAQAQLAAILEPLRRQVEPDAAPALAPSIRLVPLSASLFGYYTSYSWLISASAALVFLIACVNLASLFIVRGRSREANIAMQLALGAPRRRLLRAAFVETAFLAIAGAAVAVATLAVSAAALKAVLPPILSRYAAGAAEPRVLIFAALTALACAIAVASAYAPRSNGDLVSALHHTASQRLSRRRVASALIAIEAALSVVLVAGAAVAVRNFAQLTVVDLGYEPARLATVTIRTPMGKDRAVNYGQAREILSALAQVPGIERVAGADPPLLVGAAGDPFGGDIEGDGAERFHVTEGLVEAIGLRVLHGRAFAAEDVGTDVAMLSKSAVQRVWPGTQAADAVGRLLQLSGEPARQVVGVTADLRSSPAASRLTPLFLPIVPQSFRFMWFHVKTREGSSVSLPVLRDAVRRAGFAPTAVSIAAASERLRDGLREPRFRAVLFGLFGITALVLAAVGLYALTAFDAAQRRREIGIRLAIGATAIDVRRQMLKTALQPVVVGAAAGLIGAYWALRGLERFVVGIDVRDPATLLVAAATLVATAACAAWWPAMRAARTEPAVVLRTP